MNSWSDNPELAAASGGSSGSTSSLQSLQNSSSSSITPTPIPAAPAAPDISELTGLFNKIPGLFNTKGIAGAYNSQINTTQSEGMQAASDAAGSYSAREQQMGINPVAAGVVEAGARAPTYSAVNDLTKGKESAILDAHQMGASLQSQIASAIGGIRSAYTKTLADYNLGAAGLASQQQQFGQSFGLQQQQFGQSKFATLLQALTQTGSNATPLSQYLMKALGIFGGQPGYEPDQGPINPSTGMPFSNGNNVALGAGITATQGGSLRV